jgi:hypothetical protein
MALRPWLLKRLHCAIVGHSVRVSFFYSLPLLPGDRTVECRCYRCNASLACRVDGDSVIVLPYRREDS